MMKMLTMNIQLSDVFIMSSNFPCKFLFCSSINVIPTIKNTAGITFCFSHDPEANSDKTLKHLSAVKI